LHAAALAEGCVFEAGQVAHAEGGEAVLADGRRLAADLTVAATGGATVLVDAPLIPIKGHIVRAAGLRLRGGVVRAKGIYVCPTSHGVVVGATMETGRSDTEVDPAAVAGLARRAAALFPALTNGQFTGAVGVRAATPDGLPIVGPVRSGLFVAAGMRRNGWLLAPLAAQMAASHLTGGYLGRFAARLDPARFEPKGR
jgi:glycine oxidase